MACGDFEPLIGDLVDGTLDGAPRHELEAHLTSCASCARMVEELLVVRRAVRALPDLPPPADGWSRLSSAVASEAPRTSPRMTTKWLAGLAAAAVVVAWGLTAHARRRFGGVTGDVIGGAVELSTMAALVVLATA